MKPAHSARLLLPLALLGSLVAGCGGDDGSDPVAQADSGESVLTLYSGREPELIDPAIEDYEKQSGVEVEIRSGDSAPLAATLLEEGDASPADVFLAQDAGSLGAVEAEGLLAPLPPEILEEVPARFRSDGGGWVGITGRARVIAYGPDVDEADVPDSPLDLVDPEWEGRVGWAPSNASLQAYVTALRTIEGEDVAREWLEGMVANGAQAYESNTPVRDAIAAGEVDLGLINHYYVAQAIAEEGADYPVAVKFPPDDLGSLINVAGAGVIASSDDPGGAQDLIEFLLAEDAQTYFADSSKEYPLAAGVEPDEALVPLDQIPAPDVDLGDTTDLEGTLELMRETGAL
ncbi:MAG: iron ABC transporter substrate-binding protein [Actinomycetota bacterium]|nr:iron ABC transporter substrate-binding protein [Actinomycetota bacterium]